MTIRIRIPPNALTKVARANKTPPSYAKSPESDMLLNALHRYWNSENKGHTVLISGHRGAGKTTLVYTILDLAERQAEDWWRQQFDKFLTGLSGY